MIAFIRKYLGSKFVLALFGLIILAFMITGFGTDGSGLGSLSLSGNNVAQVGSMNITNGDAQLRVQSEFEVARQQQPGLTLSAYDKQGGIDQTIDRMINTRVILAYARKHGMIISDRLIDSEIATTPAFYGPAGKFDRNVYENAIGQRGLTEKAHRMDVEAQLLIGQIIPAAAGAAQMPKQLSAPYASLMLERRFGQSLFIPASKYMGAAPTEAEVQTYYNRNVTKYTVPETRMIRYALFDRSRFAGKVKPTDAEIETAYKADPKYAASETRTITQVIASDEATAKKIIATAKGGASFADAAKASGLETTTLDPQDKKGFTALASAAAAESAFSGASGAVAGPARSGLGWHVMKIDRINATGATSLAQARAEIEPRLVERKIDEAMADMVIRLEEAIEDGSTFDDVVKKEGFTIVSLPAVTASGVAPGEPGFKLAPELAPILKDAFQSEAEDDPTVVTVVPKQKDALVKLDRVNEAAPKPLSAIRAQVAADAQADKAARAARKAAMDLTAKLNGGVAFAQAANGLGTPQPLTGQRSQLGNEGVPRALPELFKLAIKKSKMVEAEDKSGYTIVWLERLEAGDAKNDPQLLAAANTALGQAIGNEYVEQLIAAMRTEIGVQRNDAVIAALKRSMLGGSATQ